jgi:ABC-type glycerol-3-phosphate transport system permease component
MYQFASNGEYALNVPVLMAFVMLSALPLLVLYIGLRRQFVKGIGGFALR